MKDNINNTPTISVLMSVYNEQESWLREAIESILNQTYADFEFIIILDNPENEMIKKIIQEYIETDKRIIFLENKENLGSGPSKNRGLKIARGKYIAIMDADDISLPERFAKQIGFMKNNPEIDLVGSWAEIIDENSDIIGLMKNACQVELINKMLPYISTAYHSSWLVKKEVYSKLNGYQEYSIAEDYDFLLRTNLNKFSISNINNYLIRYRIRTNQLSQKNALAMQKSVTYLKKIYKKELRTGKNNFSLDKLKKINKSNKISNLLYQKSNYYFIKAKLNFFKNNKSKIKLSFYLFLSFLLSPYWGGLRIHNIIIAKIIERKYKNKLT